MTQVECPMNECEVKVAACFSICEKYASGCTRMLLDKGNIEAANASASTSCKPMFAGRGGGSEAIALVSVANEVTL